MDFLSKFVEKMRSVGCGPAYPDTIMADDKKYRYQIEDEKRGKKSGRYQLKIEGDFAVGWFLDFRQGVTHRFTSQSAQKSKYSPEDWERYRTQREAAQKAQLDQRRADHAKAAKKAQAIWDKSATTGSTGYLERKGARLNGARIWRENIVVVPVKVGGVLTSLQFISPDGSKRFLTGSELAGGYFSMASAGDDLTRIVIVEGFATGDAVRRATGAVVVVAFNAGNLKEVATALRRKYPTATLVFASDNDAWTSKKPGDTPWNPGTEYAVEAARAVGNARVAVARFLEEDLNDRPTDWNDALLIYGAEYVRNGIDAAAQPEETRIEYGGRSPERSLEIAVQPGDSTPTSDGPYDAGEYGAIPPEPPVDVYRDELASIRDLPDDGAWWKLVIKNAKHEPKATSLQNAILFLRYHDAFRGIFAYNLFHNNLMVVRCPPWEKQETFSARRIDDVAITNCTAELEKYGLTMGADKVFKAIQSTAMEFQFHPARNYFNGLIWDRKPRLDTWLSYYMGCDGAPPEYLAFVGKKWMVAAVYRIFHPGRKFDQVLVIEGEQGVGKSTALRYMATFGRDYEECYFSDGINLTKLDDKDTTMKLQGAIIIELAELSGFGKKEDEALKHWIGRNEDEDRLPFDRTLTKFGRQFVLSATTNKTDYLKDPTGNRRYWPVHSYAIDLQAIKADREQLWAEAVYLYEQGFDIIPTQEEALLARAECAKRLAQDIWNDTVMGHVKDILDGRGLMSTKGFKIAEVMAAMGLALRDRDERSARRISGILQVNGFESRSVYNRENGKTERMWVEKVGAV